MHDNNGRAEFDRRQIFMQQALDEKVCRVKLKGSTTATTATTTTITTTTTTTTRTKAPGK
jgi:hypothetical protein